MENELEREKVEKIHLEDYYGFPGKIKVAQIIKINTSITTYNLVRNFFS